MSAASPPPARSANVKIRSTEFMEESSANVGRKGRVRRRLGALRHLAPAFAGATIRLKLAPMGLVPAIHLVRARRWPAGTTAPFDSRREFTINHQYLGKFLVSGARSHASVAIEDCVGVPSFSQAIILVCKYPAGCSGPPHLPGPWGWPARKQLGVASSCCFRPASSLGFAVLASKATRSRLGPPHRCSVREQGLSGSASASA